MNKFSFKTQEQEVPGQGVMMTPIRAQSCALPSVEQPEYNPTALILPPPSPSPASIRRPSQTWSASPQPTPRVSATTGKGGIRLNEKQEQILLQIMYQLRDTYNQNGYIFEWWRQVQFQFLEATNIEYENACQYSEGGLRFKFIERKREDSGGEYPDGSWMQAAHRWYEEVIEPAEEAARQKEKEIDKAVALSNRTHTIRNSMTTNLANKPTVSRVASTQGSVTPLPNQAYQDFNLDDTDEGDTPVTRGQARKSVQRRKRQRLLESAEEVQEQRQIITAMVKKVLQAPTPSITAPALEGRVLELEKQVARLQGMVEILQKVVLSQWQGQVSNKRR